MTNEQIVDEIRNGFSVTDNLQWLYERNLPLIKHIIKPYTYFESSEDLQQEAFLALWEATKHYETAKCVPFMRYAEYWIKAGCQRYIENCGSIVRLPAHLREQIARYKRNVQQLQQELGREPTNTEIAEYLGIAPDRLRKLQLCMYDVASLDAPLSPDSSDDENFALADTLPADFNIEESTIEIYEEYQKSELWGVLGHFMDESQQDLLKRFAAGQNLAEISWQTGESYQSVRRRFDNILRRLKTGKPRRELLERLEILSSNVCRGSFRSFCEHDDILTSSKI